MRHISVALLTGSAIVDAGLRVITLKLNDRGVDVYSVDESSITENIAELAPSLLIVAPDMLSTVTVGELKELTGGSTAIVAVTTHLLPAAAIREFDAVISLFDSTEKILDTLRDTISGADDEEVKDISPRERDIIIGIVKGLSNKEIANDINVSVNTVMTHRRNIARKLRIHSPAALTVYAIVKKLVNIDEIKTILPA